MCTHHTMCKLDIKYCVDCLLLILLIILQKINLFCTLFQCEVDTAAETLYLDEERNLDQKLWLAFQNTASAMAQLYKGNFFGVDNRV